MPSTTTDATLPAWEELEAFWKRTSELVEALDDEIARRVFAVINRDGPQEVTFEQIGQLLVFVRWMRGRAEWLGEKLDQLEQVALADLDEIRLEGRMTTLPTFTEYGLPTPPPTAAQIAEWVAGEGRDDA